MITVGVVGGLGGVSSSVGVSVGVDEGVDGGVDGGRVGCAVGRRVGASRVGVAEGCRGVGLVVARSPVPALPGGGAGGVSAGVRAGVRTLVLVGRGVGFLVLEGVTVGRAEGRAVGAPVVGGVTGAAVWDGCGVVSSGVGSGSSEGSASTGSSSSISVGSGMASDGVGLLVVAWARSSGSPFHGFTTTTASVIATPTQAVVITALAGTLPSSRAGPSKRVSASVVCASAGGFSGG